MWLEMMVSWWVVAQLLPGKFGNSLVLDGSGDYLSMQDFAESVTKETLPFPHGLNRAI